MNKIGADGGAVEAEPSTVNISGAGVTDAVAAVETASGKSEAKMGFIIPAGYFFLDVDHKDTQSDLVQALLKQFPTYAEISPSGNGIHIYGKCDASRHPVEVFNGKPKLNKRYYVKNPKNGMEIYIGGLTNRYSTFTGNRVSENVEITDCTVPLLKFLEEYMRRNEQPKIEPIDKDKYIKLTEGDVGNVIDELRKQKNGDKFKALFDKGEIPDGKSASEADVTLCALIAFRVGSNLEMVDRIFRKSKLYREKWEREDYAQNTIEAGIAACNGTFHFSVLKRSSFVIEKKGKLIVSPTELAEYVEKQLHYIAIEESLEFRRLYVYKNGIYKPVSREGFSGKLRELIKDYDYHLVNLSTIKETVSALYSTRQAATNDILNSNDTYINVQNGLLDITTMKLLPHNPKVYSTIQLPLMYEPTNTKTETFDAYMDYLTSGKEDKIRFLLEFSGAVFSNVPGFEMKKSLFQFGPGNSGKSQLKRLVEKILGYPNCVTIDLRHMKARFGSSSIYGKRMAGSADMSFMTVGELNIFKQTTDGDAIHAEFKGKDKFWFTYRSLL